MVHLKYMTPRPRAMSGDLNDAVAATLNGERAAAALTYDQLAERANINLRTLKRYISPTHDRDITVAAMGRLAVVFDLSIQEIMRRAELRMQSSPPQAPARKAPTKKVSPRSKPA